MATRAEPRIRALNALRERLLEEERLFDAGVIDAAIRSWRASIRLNKELSTDAKKYHQLVKKADEL